LNIFGITFEPEMLETQSRALKTRAYSSLESKNTASQNIGAWDQMMTSYN